MRVRDAQNVLLGLWCRRAGLIVAVSLVAAGIQTAFYGAYVVRRLPLDVIKLQSTLATISTIGFAAASVICIGLTLIAPSVASVFDSIMPCNVRKGSGWLAKRNRRNLDGDDDECCDDEVHEHCGGGWLTRLVRTLQHPETADNALTIFLTILWHCVMSSPICALIFENWKVAPSAHVVFQSITGIVAVVMAVVSIQVLRSSGIYSLSPVPQSTSTSGDSKRLAQHLDDGAVASPELRRRKGTGSSAAGGAQPSATPSSSSPVVHISTLRLLWWPFAYHALAASVFLFLHVDRGGEIHFHPFD